MSIFLFLDIIQMHKKCSPFFIWSYDFGEEKNRKRQIQNDINKSSKQNKTDNKI